MTREGAVKAEEPGILIVLMPIVVGGVMIHGQFGLGGVIWYTVGFSSIAMIFRRFL